MRIISQLWSTVYWHEIRHTQRVIYQLVYEVINGLASLDEEYDAARGLQFRDHVLERLCTDHFCAFGLIF